MNSSNKPLKGKQSNQLLNIDFGVSAAAMRSLMRFQLLLLSACRRKSERLTSVDDAIEKLN